MLSSLGEFSIYNTHSYRIGTRKAFFQQFHLVILAEIRKMLFWHDVFFLFFVFSSDKRSLWCFRELQSRFLKKIHAEMKIKDK